MARSGAGSIVPNSLGRITNRSPLDLPALQPVGSFRTGASPHGALDMLGNVFEWVSDRYGADYYICTRIRSWVLVIGLRSACGGRVRLPR